MMRKNYGFILIITIACAMGLPACNREKARPKPDVSSVAVNPVFERFDQDFFDFRKKDFESQRLFMAQKYGTFFPFFTDRFVIGPRDRADTADVIREAITGFVNDPYIRRLQDSVNVHFPSTKPYEAELAQAMRYFRHYFPKAAVPDVYFINSGFSISAFSYEHDKLAVGLDLYLGGNNPDYDSAGIYGYLRHKMEPQYISRNAMEVLFNLYFEEDAAGRVSFLEAMVNKGRKLYVLSYLMPDAPEALVAGFTAQQMEWCRKNELSIWQFFNDKDLLYDNDFMTQKRFLEEGPTPQGMPAEAPGNVGSWVGWQIVRKFMDGQEGKVSLEELLIKYDAKTIIAKAKYRPK